MLGRFWLVSVEVREILPHEYDEAGSATASAWHEYVEPYPAFGWEKFLRHVADIRSRANDAIVFGAFEDGRPLGTVTLELERRSIGCYEVAADTAYVGLLGVARTARRRGIANALMQASIEEARRRGMRAVVLTYDPVDVPPRMLYEGLGFLDTGHRTSDFEVIAQLDLMPADV
jgi:GNAT superfamily N-acetyltransferase